MDKRKRADVDRFLAEFRSIALSGRGIDLIPRAEKNEALLELGLTVKGCKEEILALSAADYSSGPKPDRERSGTVWIFGKVIEGKEVYIKLKIAHVEGIKIAKCISFHIAGHPLEHPLSDQMTKG